MRIGIDMRGTQLPGETSRLPRDLVNQLLSRFPEHHWALFFDGGLPGADSSWAGGPEIYEVRRAGPLRDQRASSDGLIQQAYGFDVLLLTGGLDEIDDYLPPPRLAPGPRMAAILYAPLAETIGEPRLAAAAPAKYHNWSVERLRQYDVIFAVSEAVRSTVLSALGSAPDEVVTLAHDAGDAANVVMEALVGLQSRPERGGVYRRRRARPRRRIAFFSPFPPARSGISDYSVRLLEALKQHYAIDLFHDAGYTPQLGTGARDFPTFDYRLFPKFQRVVDYAGIVYQMGNSGFHGFIYDTLLKYPGLVVLHDFCLTDLHYWYSLQPGVDKSFLVREIERESPELAEEYRASHARWASEPGGMIEACHRRGLTLNRRVITHAAGLVHHDSWGAQRVKDLQLADVPLPCVIPQGALAFHTTDQEKVEIRRKYGLASDELIVGCFGIVHSIKYPLEVVEAFQALVREFPSTRLLFVGRDVSGGQAQAKAEELGLADRVQFLGHVSMEAFLELAAVTDIGVNLRRPPTRGETSAALMTLLGCGVPSIVTDADAFSIFPDTVVEKVPPLASDDRSLEEALRKLAERPDYRRELGAAAVRYVEEVHNWPRVARLYAAAIENLRAGRWPDAAEGGDACVLLQSVRAA
ncbi:MAG: glycosyltransferase family 4 protein [Pirellulales bacterium]